MNSIVELLERQRYGCKKFDRNEIGFKDLTGSSDGNAGDIESCPLFAARFCPLTSLNEVLAVAAEDGNVIVRNTSFPLSTRSPGTYQLLKAHNNAIFDLTWAVGKAQFVTASGDHSAALWDASGPSLKHMMSFVGHTRSVRTVAASPTDSNLFATGSRDGSVMLWDCRGPKELTRLRLYPDNTISHCHAPNLVTHSKSNGVESVTSIVFTDENTLATCVAGQGSICFWDIRRTYRGSKRRPGPKNLLHHPTGQSTKGYSCLTVSPCRLKLFASCIDSTIYCFNIGTFSEKPIREYYGHTTSSFYIKHSISPCGRYLISGSGDNKAYIWRDDDCNPITVLTGHLSEVTSAAWSTYSPFKIVTASEDGSYTVWSLNPAQPNDDDCNNNRSVCTPLPPAKHNIKPVLTCRFKCKKGTITKQDQFIGRSPIKSPIKQLAKKPRLELSPMKSEFSPTAGLPNYVIDGTSPCILTRSSKKKKHCEDWLTKLRRETTPGCKVNQKKVPTPQSSKAKGNLLKFFCSPSKRAKVNKPSNGDALVESCEPVLNNGFLL